MNLDVLATYFDLEGKVALVTGSWWRLLQRLGGGRRRWRCCNS